MIVAGLVHVNSLPRTRYASSQSVDVVVSLFNISDGRGPVQVLTLLDRCDVIALQFPQNHKYGKMIFLTIYGCCIRQ